MTGVLCMMALAKISYCVSKFLIQKIKSVISMQGSKKTPRRVMVHVIPGRRWHQLYNTAESDYPRTVYECIIFRIMSYLSLIAQLKSPIWY